MKTATLWTLCLALFLPFIFGQDTLPDYDCTFPDYLKGTLTTGVKYENHSYQKKYKWHVNFPDQLFQWNKQIAEVYAFGRRRVYEVNDANGCVSSNMSTSFKYAFIPHRGVPLDADEVDTDEEDVVYFEHGEGYTLVEYKVRLVDNVTCIPLQIYVEINEHPRYSEFYTFTSIVNDTAKDIGFYKSLLNRPGANQKCSDVDDLFIG